MMFIKLYNETDGSRSSLESCPPTRPPAEENRNSRVGWCGVTTEISKLIPESSRRRHKLTGKDESETGTATVSAGLSSK